MQNEFESDGALLQRLGTDARKWADEFQNRIDGDVRLLDDEEWLAGWFANAIMAGFDEHKRQSTPRTRMLHKPDFYPFGYFTPATGESVSICLAADCKVCRP